MRAAILTRDYPPRVGGVATHVSELVGALRGLGVEADVFVGGDDVRTLMLPFDIPLKRYDLVHAQSTPYGAFVAGVPLVVTTHAPVVVELPQYRRSQRLAAIPAVALERASLARARVVFAVSPLSATDLERKCGVERRKISVIGNGVDHRRFSLSRGNASPDRILMVSRLEPRKNVLEAVEAVAELPPGSYALQVAGDGSQRALLEQRARALSVDASFLGRVDGRALPSLCAEAGIFLTTSISEGFGLSLLEAMASGCACVASDLPPHRELITHGVNGLLYGTRAELVSELRRLTSSPDEVARFGVAAREASMEYSWEKVASRVLGGYRRVVGE